MPRSTAARSAWGPDGNDTGAPRITRLEEGAASRSDRRLARLGRLAWLLDRSLSFGRWKFGLDPIIGLLPGIGDAVGAGLSLYIVYEAARLGAPARVLGRMLVNIAVETAVGALPLVGDIFDFAWQANTRNLALLDQLLSPEWRPRPLGRVLVASVIAGAALVTGLLACAWWVFHALVRFTPFAGR